MAKVCIQGRSFSRMSPEARSSTINPVEINSVSAGNQSTAVLFNELSIFKACLECNRPRTMPSLARRASEIVLHASLDFWQSSTHEKVPPSNCDHPSHCGVVLWGNLRWCHPVQRLQELQVLWALREARRDVWYLRRSSHSEALGQRPQVEGQSHSTTLTSSNRYEPSSSARRAIHPRLAVRSLIAIRRWRAQDI